MQAAESEYYEAAQSFRRQFAARELETIIAQGIAAEIRQDYLLIYVTAAELAGHKLENVSQYMFWLAPKNMGPADL